ncbi:histidine kinase hhk5p [Diplodia corticola]|uniref:histidine kinase n=1 Tax=Diplodia corticola TaxID=236234 RepID=A0A1J9R2W1_9PEZI|nr:histidine kinase hhk5p [Diplodia corticola]OJD35750.1 histidine kinase hhk5p [Diplodia corticola]
MRIPIREQLGCLVLLVSLIALAVVAAATWITNYNFVLDIRASRLTLTASLKASQLASNLLLMQSTVRSASSRIVIQRQLQRYNDGNETYRANTNWTTSQTDLAAVFDGGQQMTLLLQAQIWPKTYTGLAADNAKLAATASVVSGTLALPMTYDNGSTVYLGDPGLGYPPRLYPNLTFTSQRVNDTFNETLAQYAGQTLNETGSILLGPWELNETFSLMSLTVPIINNTSALDILGWMTVLVDAKLVYQTVNAGEGLDSSGLTLIVGPDTINNRFSSDVLYSNNSGSPASDVSVHFVLPPGNIDQRHASRAWGTAQHAFDYNQFPAVKKGLTTDQNSPNNAGSMISTVNEERKHVAVGFAIPSTTLCDWIVLVEQAHDEVWQPINHLRNILIACVFGTAGAILLLTLPLAHYSVRPIRQLRSATQRSVSPTGYLPDDSSVSSGHMDVDDPDILARKEGFMSKINSWRHRGRRTRVEQREVERRRQFRIPEKVRDHKHLIHDELTDLTTTFNEMTDELMMQYEKLEERVKQRTAELEEAMKAAEAANESKTLFIANISHELKTPLNGILGMCAVCMSEEDPIKLKRSMSIIYKSGDLLLNLLTDLLTFSKNQMGHQQLSLDEKEFRLRDVSTQVLAIFDKQAKENGITLSVRFEGPADVNADESAQRGEQGLAPFGLGRIKDMILWGDQHRILQVLINLVSNALKFTPRGGSVSCTIRCVGDANVTPGFGSRKGSLNSSRQNSGRNSRNRGRLESNSMSSQVTSRRTDTANQINVLHDKAYAHILEAERAQTPPPGRFLTFEFEVEDTGPGVPEYLQQRIFEPFVQGDLGLSKKFGGTGLGLSICQQLATLMRGTITLKSTVGQGSTFTVEAPLRHLKTRADSTASSRVSEVPNVSRKSSLSIESPTSRTAEENTTTNVAPVSFESDSQPRLVGLRQPFFASPTPLDSPGSQGAAMDRIAAQASNKSDRLKVLVAEDNKTNQEVVLRMLKLEDVYDVQIAKDGQEALDKVKESMENQNPYDLIFMDVQMPNLDGIQSTRLIRQAGYSAPIVALTAYAEESNVKECYESGMDYFLSKPIRRPALKHVLKTYCAPIPEETEPGDSPPLDSKKTKKGAAPNPKPAAKPKAKDETPGPSPLS